jgi:hypothetical protein
MPFLLQVYKMADATQEEREAEEKLNEAVSSYNLRVDVQSLHEKFRVRHVNGLVSFVQARAIASEMGIEVNDGFDHMYRIYQTNAFGIGYMGLKLAFMDLHRIHEQVALMEEKLQIEFQPSGRIATSHAYRIMEPYFPPESRDKLKNLIMAKSNFYWKKAKPGDYVSLMRPKDAVTNTDSIE